METTGDAAAPTTVTYYPEGPYLVRGPFQLLDSSGRVVELQRRTIALCRCGKSSMKPLCDGSHKKRKPGPDTDRTE